MLSALPHVRSLFSGRWPVHLTLFVTRRCNARCPFCFYEKARDAEDGSPELTLDEIRRVARSMGRLLWVALSGGEVFLREDLVEVSGILHDSNRAGFLTYPTNGSLPEIVEERTEEILRRCADSVVVLKLSLDGVGEDHDRLRRVPGGFRKVMQTYERLAALAARYPRLELGVNTLFCSDNQWRMREIVEFVGALGAVRSHTLTMVRGQLREGRYKEVDLHLYRKAVDLLERRWGKRRNGFHHFAGGRLKAAQDRLQRRLIHETLLEGRRLVPCQAGRLNLVLTERGELHPCEERWDLSFGNVREAGYDVPGMLRTERAAGVLAESAGGDCHCSHECNFLINILFNPRMHPRLLGEYARLRLGLGEAVGGGEEGERVTTAVHDGRYSG
jgi:MoaA/NifB/PqqE/SkfB family radical SAM enzyme